MANTIYINQISGNISLYPNPATSTITLSNVVNGQVIRILGMDGNVYKTLQITAAPMQVNVSALPAGIYILQVFSNSTITGTIKFTKK